MSTPKATPTAPLSPSNLYIAASEFYLSPGISPSPATPITDTHDPASGLHLIPPVIRRKLEAMGTSRMQDMRASDTVMQIVSHIPLLTSPKQTSLINDTLYLAIRARRTAYAAMALLPEDPVDAAQELERCVREYKFVGGVVGLDPAGTWTTGGGFVVNIDDVPRDRLWRVAEQYGVPVRLGAQFPRGNPVEYRGGLLDVAYGPIATHFHMPFTASVLPVIHLYAGGVFDRYPGLRIVVSSSCLVPALVPRINSVMATVIRPGELRRSFQDVWETNFYVTTEDVYDVAGMGALLEQVPRDRVMYATAYPFEKERSDVMKDLKDSGLVTTDEWERIAWGNAEWLFGLRRG